MVVEAVQLTGLREHFQRLYCDGYLLEELKVQLAIHALNAYMFLFEILSK
jgi:hypothetical protein